MLDVLGELLALLRLVGAVVHGRHAAGAQPSAIGLSGQMHGLVMTSRDGGALRPALLWADSRATGSLRVYRRLGSRALARLAEQSATFKEAAQDGLKDQMNLILTAKMAVELERLDFLPDGEEKSRISQCRLLRLKFKKAKVRSI